MSKGSAELKEDEKGGRGEGFIRRDLSDGNKFTSSTDTNTKAVYTRESNKNKERERANRKRREGEFAESLKLLPPEIGSKHLSDRKKNFFPLALPLLVNVGVVVVVTCSNCLRL